MLRTRPSDLDHSLRCVFRQMVAIDAFSVRDYYGFRQWVDRHGGLSCALASFTKFRAIL